MAPRTALATGDGGAVFPFFEYCVAQRRCPRAGVQPAREAGASSAGKLPTSGPSRIGQGRAPKRAQAVVQTASVHWPLRPITLSRPG